MTKNEFKLYIQLLQLNIDTSINSITKENNDEVSKFDTNLVDKVNKAVKSLQDLKNHIKFRTDRSTFVKDVKQTINLHTDNIDNFHKLIQENKASEELIEQLSKIIQEIYNLKEKCKITTRNGSYILDWFIPPITNGLNDYYKGIILQIYVNNKYGVYLTYDNKCKYYEYESLQIAINRIGTIV